MKGTGIFAAVTAALALTASSAFADTTMKVDVEMEKCKVVDKDGKGKIKAGKGDCASSKADCKAKKVDCKAKKADCTNKNSCAGTNKDGEAEAWIFVPKGECAKINAGDFSGVSDAIKDKVEGAK